VKKFRLKKVGTGTHIENLVGYEILERRIRWTVSFWRSMYANFSFLLN